MQGRQADPSYGSWLGAVNHLDMSADSTLWHSFWQDVDQLDQHKHTDIAVSLAELARHRP